MAGTITAALNGEGVVGVAPGVELYALKVLDSNGIGNLYDIIAALDWACGNNHKNIVVQITNNSYGSPVDDASGLLQLAFDLSYSNPFEDWNLLHVAAAGNSGTDGLPARCGYGSSGKGIDGKTRRNSSPPWLYGWASNRQVKEKSHYQLHKAMSCIIVIDMVCHSQIGAITNTYSKYQCLTKFATQPWQLGSMSIDPKLGPGHLLSTFA